MSNEDKKADLAGPGVSTYEEVEKIFNRLYTVTITPKKNGRTFCSKTIYQR